MPPPCRLRVPVTARHDPGADLAAYMRLPVSQYVLIDVPMGGSLQRVSADEFELSVPRLQFWDVWVQPRVWCRVRCALSGGIAGQPAAAQPAAALRSLLHTGCPTPFGCPSQPAHTGCCGVLVSPQLCASR